MIDRGLSERRSLGALRMSASAFRYEPRPDRNVELRKRILALEQHDVEYLGVVDQCEPSLRGDQFHLLNANQLGTDRQTNWAVPPDILGGGTK